MNRITFIIFNMVYGIEFDYDATCRKQFYGLPMFRHGRMALGHVLYELIAWGHIFI